MGGQVVDDGVEFIVCAVGPLVYHVADDLLPAILCIAVTENDFRCMTAATDFLHCRFAGTVGKL